MAPPQALLSGRRLTTAVKMHQREVITRLFATATSFAETAHQASCDGQAYDSSPEQYRSAVRRILSATHDLEALAEVIDQLVDQLDQLERPAPLGSDRK